ncbi:MAG: recombinase family protein, partial [Acutalibacter sp.]|nr:recombinase family protein [Acutalibacter sp.]
LSSDLMASDIRRGLRDNAENCMVTNGTLPFGYRKTPELKYELDEPKDAIVREIFSRAACGEPFVDIAADLNARGIRTSRGNAWGKNSFHVLLTNERYTGTYIYGDIRVPGGIPRIVSDELFYKVQEVLKTKKNPQGRHRVNGDYTLTGKLFCGKCKSPMVGMSGTSHTREKHYYYACQKKRTEKTCDKKNVQRDAIEEAVARAIKQYALQDDIIEWIADSTVEYFRKKQEESHVSILEDELAEAKRAAKNIMTAIEQGIITPTTKSRLLEVEERQAQLTAQIASERADIIAVNREDMIAGLEVFREGDITDKRFQAKLFDTFLVAVYLYDDDMKIVFSFSGDKNTLRLKLDADMLDGAADAAAPEGSFKLSFGPPQGTREKRLVSKGTSLFLYVVCVS